MAMAESPATALRRYQTDLRKLIRGGFNRYADCKKCWVVWTDDGRDALTDAANAAIVGDVGASRPMPHRLNALNPGLDRALRTRRKETMARQLKDLKSVHSAGRKAVFAAIEECERVADEARDLVKRQFQSTPEASSPDEPALFGSLSGGDMIDLLASAIGMIRKDCEAKAALLEETVKALEEADPAAAALRAKLEKSDGDDGADEDDGLVLSREALTTIVATWILNPYVNKEVLAEIDAVAALEMKD